MKYKIAIVSLNGYFNYGNRLQIYALKQTIEKFYYDVDTIIINSIKNSDSQLNLTRKIMKHLRKTKIDFIKTVFKYLFNNIKIINYNLFYKNLIIQREKLLIEFSNKYLSEKFYTANDLNYLNSLYKYFVAGSDQIWNPFFSCSKEIYFLRFVDFHKRIAYAPSFGITEIPEEYKELYKLYLSEIPYLSVRELSGAKIIKDLTGRDVPVLIDPTMLLTKEDWLLISKPHKNKPKNKYLIAYFLGKITKEGKKIIRFLSKKYNLRIVYISNKKYRKFFIVSPQEFIDYINNASIVITDSYHGTVFSILFNKPFIVVNRVKKHYNMYSRIETLFAKFGFKSREIGCIDLNSNIFNMNFSYANKILEEERKKSIEYLKKALLNNS